MTIPSFMAFMVFMFVFGVALVLICAWFVSDFVFKRLYLKDIERRLVAILEKHGIEVQTADYHSKTIPYNPSIRELVCMLEAVYGIDNMMFDDEGLDFSAFQKFLQKTSKRTNKRAKQNPTCKQSYPILEIKGA